MITGGVLSHIAAMSNQKIYIAWNSVVEEIFGKDHLIIAGDLNNLADLYQRQNKYAEAVGLYKRILEILEKALGPNHANVATVCETMSRLHRKLGQEDEAERLEERARRVRSVH